MGKTAKTGPKRLFRQKVLYAKDSVNQISRDLHFSCLALRLKFWIWWGLDLPGVYTVKIQRGHPAKNAPFARGEHFEISYRAKDAAKIYHPLIQGGSKPLPYTKQKTWS